MYLYKPQNCVYYNMYHGFYFIIMTLRTYAIKITRDIVIDLNGVLYKYALARVFCTFVVTIEHIIEFTHSRFTTERLCLDCMCYDFELLRPTIIIWRF